MSYFNISLDLGYNSTLEVMQAGMLNIISANAHITQKDLVSFIDTDDIVIIKSFLRIEDVSKIYLALDKICCVLLDELRDASAYSFHICYGNVYGDIFDAAKSYNDAKEIMSMSLAIHPENGFYTLEDIFFESVCDTLHPQIINKIIRPYLKSLMDENGKLKGDLLKVAAKYVDNCMRIGKTAEDLYLHRNTVDSKLEQFKKITGLDPAKSYRDSFLIKMLVIYYQKNSAGHT